MVEQERRGPRRPEPLEGELYQIERELEEPCPKPPEGEAWEIENWKRREHERAMKRLKEDLIEARRRLPKTGKHVDITI